MIFILMLFSLLKLTYSWSVNEIIIKNYNQNVYDNILVKTLYFLNFNEPYIAYYNEGNILYRLKNYDEAINKYQEALQRTNEQAKICDIRINLTLAKYQKIDLKSSQAYEDLETLKENLDLDNCHGKDTKNLDQEITDIQNNLSNDEPNDSSDESNEDKESDDEQKKDDLEKELKEIERQAQENRQADMEFYEHFNDDIFYDGDSW